MKASQLTILARQRDKLASSIYELQLKKNKVEQEIASIVCSKPKRTTVVNEIENLLADGKEMSMMEISRSLQKSYPYIYTIINSNPKFIKLENKKIKLVV